MRRQRDWPINSRIRFVTSTKRLRKEGKPMEVLTEMQDVISTMPTVTLAVIAGIEGALVIGIGLFFWIMKRRKVQQP